MKFIANIFGSTALLSFIFSNLISAVISEPLPDLSRAKKSNPMKAVVFLKTDTVVYGNVTFSQMKKGSPVSIQVSLSGLKPGSHGIHIHEFGDLTGGCASSGGNKKVH